MNPEDTCHFKILEERVERERELREALESKLDERDLRYGERFIANEKAVYAALSSQEKLTGAAFAASEKAISKAESSQISYNLTHNDLTRKMDAQYKDTLQRTEAESKFKAIEEKISDLRESRSTESGRSAATAIFWSIGASILTAVIVLLATKYFK